MDRQSHRRVSSAARSAATRLSVASTQLFEGLEPRRLFAGISLAGDGTLGVVGTTGNDTISVNLSGSQIVAKLNATTKSFPLSSVKKLSLSGDAGADTLAVGGTVKLPATLKGGAGNDKLVGGGGNDSLDGGTGADDLRGGGGTDTADYSARTKSVRVQIEDVANDGEINEGDNVHSDVENVTGGSAGDVLKGSFYANVLIGGGGGDQIFGFEGNDTLRGGDGDDQLDGGAGNDQLYGDAGLDFLEGGAGADDFWGGAGGGGSGSFVTADVVDYSDHAGSVTASLDDKRNDGAAGENDYIHADVEGLVASRGGSTLIGNATANYLVDGAGDDTIFGNGGDDDLQGQNGGSDTFYGGDGDDHILSGGEDRSTDRLYGGAGDDELEDNGGNGDLLDGGAGHDRLDKYQGTGTLTGGPDADIINGVVEAGILGVAKSADGKTLTITGTGLADGIGVRPAAVAGQIEIRYSSQVPVTVATAGLQKIVINAGGRDDSVDVYPGVTTPVVVNAGAGNDIVSVYDAPSEQYGGAGRDILNGGSKADLLDGGDGNDDLGGGEGDDLLRGGAGIDYLQGGTGADRLYGGDGDDRLDGTDPNTAPVADYLDGGLGTDLAQKDNLDATFSVEQIDRW